MLFCVGLHAGMLRVRSFPAMSVDYISILQVGNLWAARWRRHKMKCLTDCRAVKMLSPRRDLLSAYTWLMPGARFCA